MYKKTTTIGILIQHYDARNDIRAVVELVSKTDSVVLFGSREVLQEVDGSVEKRELVQERCLRHRMWFLLFLFFGKLPASRGNFYVTELFKLSGLGWRRRLMSKGVLKLRMILPKFITYDGFLDKTYDVDQTEIDDVDRFLVITEVANTFFLARLIKKNVLIDMYVYSWDHACKHVTMSKRASRYLVWSEGIAEDLVELQGIDRERIKVVGATQLSFVKQYLENNDNRTPVPRPNNYVYYGCGIGYEALATVEAALIEKVADALERVAPDVTLLVRPYPMLKSNRHLEKIAQRTNVQLDQKYRVNQKGRSLRDCDIFEKLRLQEHALAFLHCGTTMGLEGAYLDTPVLFLDLENLGGGRGERQFRQFVHQYHNEKYMIHDSINCVRTESELENALRLAVARDDQLLAYNRHIRRGIELRDLENIDLVS